MSRRESELFRKAIEQNVANREAIKSAVLNGKGRPLARLPKRTWIALIAAAALLLASAAYAVGSWAARENYTTESYLLPAGGERKRQGNAIADIERAILLAAPEDVSHSIRTLPQLPDRDTLIRWRQRTGQPPYSDADWGWLNEIEPKINEVLVHGNRLYWSTRLFTDHADAFSYEVVELPQKLDAFVETVSYRAEGSEASRTLFCDTHGMNPFELTEQSGMTIGECDLDEAFPKAGRVTVTQEIFLLDCGVDDMNPAIATVAVITHTFSFDAAAVSEAAEPLMLEIPLSGRHRMTVGTWDEAQRTYVERNESVNLNGASLGLKIQYRSTGIYLTASFVQEPKGWTETQTNAFLSFGSDTDPGLSVRYTVDGQTYAAQPGFNQGRGVWLLPIFPSDYEAIDSVSVELRLNRIARVNGRAVGQDWTRVWSEEVFGRTETEADRLHTGSLPIPKG